MTKEDQLIARLQEIESRYRHPAVMSSFGKDSMVMLECLRRMGRKWPVVYFRDPFGAGKERFAWQAIGEAGLKLFTWSPSAAYLHEAPNGMLETVAFYGLAPGEGLGLPRDVVPWDETDGAEAPFVCAVDWVTQPKCAMVRLPFDCLLIGHKDSDVDPVRGSIRLKCDRVEFSKGLMAEFPLRGWTDEDVWDYLERYDVPVNRARYDGRTSRPDPDVNADYQRLCRACVTAGEGPVFCPKQGREILRFGEEARAGFYVRNWEPDYYERG